METAQTITDVRKVEMYESKLVPNCGQFYTLFSLWHDGHDVIQCNGFILACKKDKQKQTFIIHLYI